MPSRKACGVDGIPAEILKHSPDSFKENLRHLVNAVFASEFKVPKDALLAKVILLYKKGDPYLLGNYRPIALLTSTYQLMNLILDYKIWPNDMGSSNPHNMGFDGYTGLQTVSKNSSFCSNLQWRETVN